MAWYDKIEWKELPPGIAYGDKVYVDLWKTEADVFPISRYVRAHKFHTWIGRDDSDVQWAICTAKSNRVTFIVEKAPHGAFALRQYYPDTDTKGHCIVRDGDWVNFTSPEDGETESLGWLPMADYWIKSDCWWTTPEQPFLLFVWSRGPRWPVRGSDEREPSLTFKEGGHFGHRPYEERVALLTKVPASNGLRGAVTKLQSTIFSCFRSD